jgi:NAD(P)-dependent dehydrogenase (short-subunit alcohol dehydrogenase family)
MPLVSGEEGAMQRFSGKVAFITGGARGIGCATAEAFAGEGVRVIVADVDGDAAAATAGTLGGGAIGLALAGMSAIGVGDKN